MQYYINRSETKQTSTGKTMKKLELAQEGKQYPIKAVTMWSDHPQFNDAVAGATMDFELYETDSGIPNPNAPGKNYINRTVLNPNSPQGVPTQSTPTGVVPNITEMAIKTHIDQKFAALKADLKIIADHLGVEAPKPTIGNTDVDYPEMTEDNNGEITDEDIPFN